MSYVSGSGTQVGNILYDCSINAFEEYRNITIEVWKRILNNLPYLYKTKGTVRSLRSLITCYGIPSTLLWVREYGGPNVSESIENTYKFDNWTHVLPFYTSQSLVLPWTSSVFDRFPSTLQVRFSTTGSSYTRANSMSIAEVYNSWSLQVVPTNDELGYIKFSIYTGSAQYAVMTTSQMPIYDNKFTFINLQRETANDSSINQTFNLDAQKYIHGEILYSVSSSLFITASENIAWASSGTLVLGASQSQYSTAFSGNIDEFRLWDTPLNERVIDTHTKFPESYIGNTLTSSYYDLLLRYSFNDPINVNNSTMINTSFNNSAPSNGYSIQSATFFGWDANELIFPYNYRIAEYEAEAHTINIGNRRYSSNKVRVESASLSGPLSPFHRREVSQYDLSQIDSPIVGIYFSPTDPINEDIIKAMAFENAGDLIGSYNSLYSESYDDLEALNRLYWSIAERRITVKEYINYIRNFDKSLFENIKKLLPARVKPILGILYEPTILERPKAKYVKPELSTHNYENTINFVEPGVTGSYIDYNVTQSVHNTYFSASGDNFENSNIYIIISASSYVGDSGSIFQQVNPVVDFETSIIYYELDNYRTPLTQSYSFVNGYQQRHYNRYLGYETWEKRLKYDGCLNTKYTTLDKNNPIEIWDSSANKLIARDDGITKLQIE